MEPGPPSLILFARTPKAGQVKTRLEPVLGAEGAARLYRAFLEDAARGYGPPAAWSAVLFADGDPNAPGLGELFPSPWRRERQAEGDLGARLLAAFREEFRRGARSALAVGSDHPVLARDRLEEVLGLLEAGHEAAVIPAEDGGYCAIGLGRGAPAEEVFREIPWSSPRVLGVTLERFAGAGLRFALLAGSYDVDRPEDLARLRKDLAAWDPEEPDFPAATAAVLSRTRGGAS